MSPAQVEAALAQLKSAPSEDMQVVEVWPEHHDVWDVWCVMGNHWRIVAGLGGGGYLGLDLPSLPVALEIAGISKRRRQVVMRALRYMEDAALAVLNAAAESQRKTA